MSDVRVTFEEERFVAEVEIRRPPLNYFDAGLIGELADAVLALDDDLRCRAIVLCAEGKHFCAGADLAGDGLDGEGGTAHLYDQGARLFEGSVPIVAAVQGAAIGGGLGLALVADLRVATPETRFRCSFSRLGFHHGFGMTVTLPAAVGEHEALRLLYTGGQLVGDEARAAGLCDRVVPAEELRSAAHEMAAEIAAAAPLAVRSIRRTMRGDLADRIRSATAREKVEQDRLRHTEDFAEGVAATAERRPPRFRGR